MQRNSLIVSFILILVLALSLPLSADTSVPETGKPAGNPMQSQLDSLVSAGTITQAQADAVISELMPPRDNSTPAVKQDFTEIFTAKLASLVTSGTITQAQADAIQAALQPPAGGTGGDKGRAPGLSESNGTSIGTDGILFKIGSPKMTVKGVEQDIDPGYQTAPVVVNGTTFVPIRAVIESLGGTVAWNADHKEATITLNNIPIVLQIGRSSATVNGATKELNGTPYISDTGRTMLPLRFITENLGHSVSWDDASQTITIK